MKKLIIAEKPSLLRKIIDALSSQGERFKSLGKNEYSESEHYVATAQFGHLLSLKDISKYSANENKNMWEVINLPFFPPKYEYSLIEDSKRRFKTISDLVKRKDIDEIIHCGDPDREGQVLIDIVLFEIKNNKPVSRPILKTLTQEGIIKAFAERRPNDEYRLLLAEGLVRMYMDFDFGINLSRYATIKTNAKPALNIGRVIGAMVTELYERDMAIANFTPQKYITVENKTPLKLKSKREFQISEKMAAEDYAKQLNSSSTIIVSVEKKKEKKESPKLFSQTSLQATLSKRYDFSPEETLSLCQKLYEGGYISYPRTNTEYMTEEEKGYVEKIISNINDGSLTFKDSKRIFDNTKIEGHSAIIPTGKEIENPPEKEKLCYQTVLNRFKAVFTAEDCVYNKTIYIAKNELEEFKISGQTLFSLGWQKYELPDKKEKDEEDDEELPTFKEGDEITTSFSAFEKETTPPKRYTVESFGKFLQNPFKKDGDTDDEDYKNILAGLEIGTESTRASIISKAIEKGYISLNKKTYQIQDRGKFLVEAAKGLGIDFSKEKTAALGKIMKDVFKGEKTMSEALLPTRKEISDIISSNNEVIQDKRIDNRASIGLCPKCGKPVYESDKGFGCSGYKDGCQFVIWKNNGFFKAIGKQVTKTYVKSWLNKEPALVRNIKSHKGSTYSLNVYYDEKSKEKQFRSEFVNQPQRKKEK